MTREGSQTTRCSSTRASRSAGSTARSRYRPAAPGRGDRPALGGGTRTRGRRARSRSRGHAGTRGVPVVERRDAQLFLFDSASNQSSSSWWRAPPRCRGWISCRVLPDAGSMPRRPARRPPPRSGTATRARVPCGNAATRRRRLRGSRHAGPRAARARSPAPAYGGFAREDLSFGNARTPLEHLARLRAEEEQASVEHEGRYPVDAEGVRLACRGTHAIGVRRRPAPLPPPRRRGRPRRRVPAAPSGRRCSWLRPSRRPSAGRAPPGGAPRSRASSVTRSACIVFGTTSGCGL